MSLESHWQHRGPLAWGLWPLSLLFCAVAAARRVAYRNGMLVSRGLPVPVIVVGNISVGGTGKTPLVIWLAQHLRGRGLRPGIVTRGYRGHARDWPRVVDVDSDPLLVGDEAVLLARRAGCPVVAGPDRVEDGRMLLERFGCDLILSDDGLQHYGLNRNIEIAVIDGERRLGNGFCLPAGPLREGRSRLAEVNLVVVNGRAGPSEWGMEMKADRLVSVRDPFQVSPVDALRGKPVLAVAGIGNPQRFFRMLQDLGMQVEGRPFGDHHVFREEDLVGAGGRPVLMTEKDAVKCESFAGDDVWYVRVDAVPDDGFVRRIDRLVKGLRRDG